MQDSSQELSISQVASLRSARVRCQQDKQQQLEQEQQLSGALQMRKQWLLVWRRAAACAGARLRSVQPAQQLTPAPRQARAADAATAVLPGLSSK
jgi:hypothetical protein